MFALGVVRRRTLEERGFLGDEGEVFAVGVYVDIGYVPAIAENAPLVEIVEPTRPVSFGYWYPSKVRSLTFRAEI